MLGDLSLRLRDGEVPGPGETHSIRLAASNPTAWLTSCRRPTDFTFGRWVFRALGVGRWVLGDFFPRFRGGEVPDPDETYALRLAAPIRTVWLSSCWSPTDFAFWALGVGRWVLRTGHPVGVG